MIIQGLDKDCYLAYNPLGVQITPETLQPDTLIINVTCPFHTYGDTTHYESLYYPIQGRFKIDDLNIYIQPFFERFEENHLYDDAYHVNALLEVIQFELRLYQNHKLIESHTLYKLFVAGYNNDLTHKNYLALDDKPLKYWKGLPFEILENQYTDNEMKDIFEILTNQERRIQSIEVVGKILILMVDLDAEIPPGWEEVTISRGRVPMGDDPTTHKVGKTGGSSNIIIRPENLPANSITTNAHRLSDTESSGLSMQIRGNSGPMWVHSAQVIFVGANGQPIEYKPPYFGVKFIRLIQKT